MPMISRQVGTVSTHVNVFVPNATVSTGAGLADIVASTVTLAWYRSDSSGVSSYTLTSGTLGTFAGSTMTQASSSLALGWYQVALPDSLFASGHQAVVHLSGAASMAPVPVLIELTKTDNQVYTSSQVFAQVNSPVTASSVTAGVNVTSFRGSAAVTTAAGVLSAGVSSVTGAVGSVTGAVASVTAPVGVSTVTIPVGVSSGSIGVSSATAAVNEAIADAFLNRNVSSGANGGRPVKEAFYVLRNKVDAELGVVYETDDTTSSWAFTISTKPNDPIISITPS